MKPEKRGLDLVGGAVFTLSAFAIGVVVMAGLLLVASIAAILALWAIL